MMMAGFKREQLFFEQFTFTRSRDLEGEFLFLSLSQAFIFLMRNSAVSIVSAEDMHCGGHSESFPKC